MHPLDCPVWEYEKIPNSTPTLQGRCAALLVGLRKGGFATETFLVDTRSVHGTMFVDLTPTGYDYFAGNYRGSEYRCLKHYNVHIRTDSSVGTPAEMVTADLEIFHGALKRGFAAQNVAAKLPDAHLSKSDKLIYLVTFVCLVLSEFLRIHPYANGNGHIGRFVVWNILGAFGFWPKAWPLEERPPDPPYGDCLKQYRQGNREPLEKFMLKCIIG